MLSGQQRVAVVALACAWLAVGVGAQEQPVAEFSHLLNVRCDARSGNLTVDRLVLVAPPRDGQRAELLLTRPDGAVLRRMPLETRRLNAFPGFALLEPRGGVFEHPAREGDFALAVSVGGTVVTTLPYALSEVLSGDSNDVPPRVFVREGSWRSLAYLGAAPGSPGGALELHWWGSAREMPGGWGMSRVQVRVLRGEEEIAVGTGVTVVSAADWEPLAAPLARPEAAGGGAFTLADLVAADGEYTIAIEARKSVLKRFVAAVKGGAVQRLDRCRPESQAGPCPLPATMVDTSAGRESKFRLVDAYWLAAASE